jgi:Ca-activated chloride channel family protein
VRRERSRRLTRIAGILRAAAILSVLAALAFPNLPLPSRSRRLVVLIDVSDSIGAESAERSRRAALDAMSSLRPRDRAAALVFAGGSRLVSGLQSPAAARRALESAELYAPEQDSTDLGAALSLAVSIGGDARGSCLLLYGDGRTNAGDPVPSELLAKTRVRLSAVPTGQAGRRMAGLGLELPEGARPGERIAAAWVLGSDDAAEIEYEVRSDGAIAAKGRANLVPGMNRITFEFDAGPEGTRLIEAGLSGGEGSRAAEASGLLRVGGGSAVLIASESGSSPIGAALRAQGLSAIERGVEGLPAAQAGYAGVSCLVLDDVPALAMTEAQQYALVEFVAGGGGLLVVGGERSLGRGEYYATPLEDILPVESDSRRRLFFTRAKILFVIDHSGSMEESVGRASKQLAAMRGVAAALDGLGPQDEVAILTFDSTPTWALRFTPAGEREEILGALSGLDEGGGTDLSSALDEVIRGFGPAGPEKRHAILLTDGLAFDADYRELARRLRSGGVSMTTVAIGDKVNEPLLKDIAQWTGGTYYRAQLDQVPKIVDVEAALLTRELIQEGRIELRSRGDTALTEGLGGAPPISGYLLTKAKPLALVHLEAPSKEGADPILASWRYGAGHVAVFASDSGRRWLSSWSTLPAFNRLWSQAVRAIERPVPDGGLRASARVEGGSARVVVEARDEEGRSASGLRLAGRRLGGGGDEDQAPRAGEGGGLSFALSEMAPGRYEALVPLAGAGLAGFELFEPGLGKRVSTWAWTPPGIELAATGPDHAALSLLASATGGKLLGEGESGVPPAVWSWERAAVRGPLVFLALVLFVAELCLRSLSFGQMGAARAAFALWSERQRSAAERIRGHKPADRRRETDNATAS